MTLLKCLCLNHIRRSFKKANLKTASFFDADLRYAEACIVALAGHWTDFHVRRILLTNGLRGTGAEE